MHYAAQSQSSVLDEKLVLAKSPSLLPKPVKLNLKTAKPCGTRKRLIREAAATSLPQVKQWANNT